MNGGETHEITMRTLKIIEHISLDGVIQSSGEDNFPYGNWITPYRTPAGLEAMVAAYGERVDMLLGRRTCDMWSGFWPKASGGPMADRLNAATKFVVTTVRKVLHGARSRALDRTSSKAFAASSRRTARTLSSPVAPR